MAIWATTLVCGLIAWIVYIGLCLFSNYRKAISMGVPVVISPASPENPLWMAFQTVFSGVLRYFPWSATSLTRHCQSSWEFYDRYKSHERYGDAWALVTPGWIWLYIADKDAIVDIFARSKEFKRPLFMNEPLNIFGPNIGGSEGQEWQRQRRLTAPALNESKMPMVWQESIRQAEDMLKLWVSRQAEGFNTTEDDIRTLALHVLAYTAFQKSYPYFSFTDQEPDPSAPMSYRDAIAIILHNAVLILVIPHVVLSWSFMPKSLRRAGKALATFREHMKQQIAKERELLSSNQPGSGSIVSTYVKASLENSDSVKPLTEAEMLGNIFVLNFAGHDTTALTMSYGIALLSVYPEVQDWIHEELAYYKDKSQTYEDTFPKLKRVQAILFETLRLYDPIPGVPKMIDRQSPATQLDINGNKFLIPPDVLVIPNMQAAHTYPRYWGNDSLQWRPQRWITSSDRSSSFETETLIVPQKGTFFPWSDGMRNCIGKKLAQAEWVATLSVLFKDHYVEPVTRNGESMQGARQRMLETVKDSNLKLLMSMRKPRDVVVRWSKRKQADVSR